MGTSEERTLLKQKISLFIRLSYYMFNLVFLYFVCFAFVSLYEAVVAYKFLPLTPPPPKLPTAPPQPSLRPPGWPWLLNANCKLFKFKVVALFLNVSRARTAQAFYM